MKKLFALSLIVVLAFSMTACGAPVSEENSSAVTPTATAVPSSTESVNEVQLKEELEALSKSVEKLEAVYNEVTPIAAENGWENDELYMKEKNASAAMIQIDKEIIKSPSMLEGKSAKDMIDGTNEMAEEWDKNMREKVSTAY